MPPAPCCVRVGGGACRQHASYTASLRTPGSSTQLACWPPAHLELLRQVQAAAYRVHGSEGRAACYHSARRQVRLGATGVPPHPTRATPGDAAVPHALPCPIPGGSHPLSLALGRHTRAGLQGLAEQQSWGRVPYGCRASRRVQDGWAALRAPPRCPRVSPGGTERMDGPEQRTQRTAEGGWQQGMGTAGWGGSARAAQLPLVSLDLGISISCPCGPWGPPHRQPVSFAWDSCVLPSEEPGSSQAGFGASPGDGHPMVRGHVGEWGHQHKENMSQTDSCLTTPPAA